jgi:hypothetical protein
VQLAVEAVGPDVRAGRRVDQLSGETKPIAAAPYTAFDHVANTEFPPDAPDIDGCAFVSERGITRDYEQPTAARQRCDDVLGHTVGEVFLFRVSAHVGERKHCDRGLVGQWQFYRIRRRRLRRADWLLIRLGYSTHEAHAFAR